jgi:transcriptional antiterminator RfaH
MSGVRQQSTPTQFESSDEHQRQWFCVQTKARHEDYAAINLENKKIIVYSPKIEEIAFRNHKNVKRVIPLFPSYIFAKLDLLFEHNKARWTPGVKQILSDRRGPIQIEDEIIDGIAAVLQERTYAKSQKLKTGDVVVVNGGSFTGLSGVFQYYVSGETRVKVLLDLIYRQVATEFDSAIIKKL